MIEEPTIFRLILDRRHAYCSKTAARKEDALNLKAEMLHPNEENLPPVLLTDQSVGKEILVRVSMTSHATSGTLVNAKLGDPKVRVLWQIIAHFTTTPSRMPLMLLHPRRRRLQLQNEKSDASLQ